MEVKTMEKILLTPTQVASILFVTPGSIYYLIKKGKLKAKRDPRNNRQYKIRKEDLDDFMHRKTTGPFLTPNQAADYLCYSPANVRRLIKVGNKRDGKLKAWRNPKNGHYKIRKSDLDDFMRRQDEK